MYSVKSVTNDSTFPHVIRISHLWSDANIKMKCKIPSAELQLFKGKNKDTKNICHSFHYSEMCSEKKERSVTELNVYVQQTCVAHIHHNSFSVEEHQIITVFVSSIVWWCSGSLQKCWNSWYRFIKNRVPSVLQIKFLFKWRSCQQVVQIMSGEKD